MSSKAVSVSEISFLFGVMPVPVPVMLSSLSLSSDKVLVLLGKHVEEGLESGWAAAVVSVPESSEVIAALVGGC